MTLISVDGEIRESRSDPDTPLLYVLRDEFGFNNPRFGCGLAQCGACVVHIDGEPVTSCVLPLGSVGKAAVVTIKGLGTPEKPHAIQLAFAEHQATQCGFCINGWVMRAAALVRDNPKANIAEIKETMAGTKCRCGAHMSIIRAIASVTGAA